MIVNDGPCLHKFSIGFFRIYGPCSLPRSQHRNCDSVCCIPVWLKVLSIALAHKRAVEASASTLFGCGSCSCIVENYKRAMTSTPTVACSHIFELEQPSHFIRLSIEPVT